MTWLEKCQSGTRKQVDDGDTGLEKPHISSSKKKSTKNFKSTRVNLAIHQIFEYENKKRRQLDTHLDLQFEVNKFHNNLLK